MSGSEDLGALAERREELENTHLFYANDALIFCEADKA